MFKATLSEQFYILVATNYRSDSTGILEVLVLNNFITRLLIATALFPILGFLVK